MSRMLKVHQKARDSIYTLIHEFKTCYRNGSSTIYAFFEGKEDLSFYNNAIQHVVPRDWSIRRWTCGNKERVFAIYNKLDWNRYPKTAIIFFVDKDLSEFLQEHIINDQNIYVTEYYSIENYLVDEEACLRLLQEVYGFINLPIKEQEIIKKMFKKEISKFYKNLVYIMGWYLCCRKINHKPCLNNIKMNKLFTFKDGILIRSVNYVNNIIEHCEDKCNVYIYNDRKRELRNDINILKKCGTPKKYIRGKYELWFMIEFLKSVHSGSSEIFASIAKKPKKNIEFGINNAVEIIGPRVRMPRSLIEFLKETCRKYVNLVEHNN